MWLALGSQQPCQFVPPASCLRALSEAARCSLLRGSRGDTPGGRRRRPLCLCTQSCHRKPAHAHNAAQSVLGTCQGGAVQHYCPASIRHPRAATNFERARAKAADNRLHGRPADRGFYRVPRIACAQFQPRPRCVPRQHGPERAGQRCAPGSRMLRRAFGKGVGSSMRTPCSSDLCCAAPAPVGAALVGTDHTRVLCTGHALLSSAGRVLLQIAHGHAAACLVTNFVVFARDQHGRGKAALGVSMLPCAAPCARRQKRVPAAPALRLDAPSAAVCQAALRRARVAAELVGLHAFAAAPFPESRRHVHRRDPQVCSAGTRMHACARRAEPAEARLHLLPTRRFWPSPQRNQPLPSSVRTPPPTTHHHPRTLSRGGKERCGGAAQSHALAYTR